MDLFDLRSLLPPELLGGSRAVYVPEFDPPAAWAYLLVVAADSATSQDAAVYVTLLSRDVGSALGQTISVYTSLEDLEAATGLDLSELRASLEVIQAGQGTEALSGLSATIPAQQEGTGTDITNYTHFYKVASDLGQGLGTIAYRLRNAMEAGGGFDSSALEALFELLEGGEGQDLPEHLFILIPGTPWGQWIFTPEELEEIAVQAPGATQFRSPPAKLKVSRPTARLAG